MVRRPVVVLLEVINLLPNERVRLTPELGLNILLNLVNGTTLCLATGPSI